MDAQFSKSFRRLFRKFAHRAGVARVVACANPRLQLVALRLAAADRADWYFDYIFDSIYDRVRRTIFHASRCRHLHLVSGVSTRYASAQHLPRVFAIRRTHAHPDRVPGQRSRTHHFGKNWTLLAGLGALPRRATHISLVSGLETRSSNVQFGKFLAEVADIYLWQC